MASNSQQCGTRSDAIVVRGVHDVGAAEYTKKLESKIDVFTTLVNQLASNQRAPATRVYGLCTSVDHFTDSCPALQQAVTSSTQVDTPQAYAAEYTKKLESKIDALTPLVNQLASNQRAPTTRVYGLCTSVDHFTDSCPALQQAATSSTQVDTPQAYAAEYTKKLESKIDALTTLVNQLASNQRAPTTRVYGLCTSVDHFTDFCPTLQQAATSFTPVDTPQAYAANIFNNNRP